jgi:hypothetical protein
MKPKLSVALVAAFLLSGCVLTGTAGTVIGVATVLGGAYCTGVTEEARAATQDALTNGVQIINCGAE